MITQCFLHEIAVSKSFNFLIFPVLSITLNNIGNILFCKRYSLLLQRTLHHKLFANPSVGIDQKSKSDAYVLSRLEYLIGSSTKLDDLIVLGMITQITEGKYHLEDTSGIVEVDLSNATFHTGIYTECCFVLAEGFYEDKVFFIKVIGLPPAETARISR